MAKKKKRKTPLKPVPKRVHKAVAQAKQEQAIKLVAVTLVVLVVTVVAMFIAVALISLIIKSPQEKPEEIVQPVTDVEAESFPESEEEFGRWLDPENPEDAKRIQEITDFYWETLDVPIKTMVLEGKFYIPETTERIKFLLQQIYGRYGKPAVINPVWDYAPGGSKTIVAQAGIRDDGTPMCKLFLPVIMQRHKMMEETGVPVWKQAFFNFLVGSIEHEFEHLALSRFPEFGNDPTPLTVEEHVAGEAEIWHHSMMYVYDPMIVGGQPIDSLVMQTYEAWKKGDKKPDSPSWLAYIEVNRAGH